jgi:hypothetical protein
MLQIGSNRREGGRERERERKELKTQHELVRF